MATADAPDLDRETPSPADKDLVTTARDALGDRYRGAFGKGGAVELVARVGPGAAYLRARVGPRRRPHEIELFVRDLAGDGLDGALGVLVDYLDGVLEELAEEGGEGSLPLDYEGRPYEIEAGSTCTVFVRGEVRDLDAEEAAEEWLKRS